MKTWMIYIAAAVGFAIYGAATDVDRDSSGAIVGAGNVNAFQVRVGDCFNDSDASSGEISSLPGIPCAEPHDNEAYAVFNVSITEYPDDETMAQLARESCVDRFDAFVGRDYESSSLDFIWMYPTVESWQQNDREVVCAVYDMDENKLVGSVKGRSL